MQKIRVLLWMGDEMKNYAAFIRTRITELRLKKDVSEYQMSLDIGKNRNYIQGILAGKSLPSMEAFINICDYCGITPMMFFDDENDHPQLVRQALFEMRDLGEEDLKMVIGIIRRLHKK